MTPVETAAETTVPNRGRMQTLGPVIAFDIVGPLAVYYGLNSAGFSSLMALILSGIVPVFGIAIGVRRERRLDSIGALVLLGIIVGSVLGAVSGSAHLVLLDGIIPTAVFGVVCLFSLRSRRPMIFRFALEGMGRDTPKGRDFADKWRYPGFRHAFQVTTAVWGVTFLAEAATQAVIVETTSTSVAKTSGNLLFIPFVAAVAAWNVGYAKRGRRRGALAEAASRARGDTPPPMPD